MTDTINGDDDDDDAIKKISISKKRCSSMVRSFAHGAVGRRINPSWWTH